MFDPGAALYRGLPAATTPCRYFPAGRIYSILILVMAKRKPARFSAAKAVKANARERVGQPKPSRVLPEKPPTGRQAKHRPKLDDLLREAE